MSFQPSVTFSLTHVPASFLLCSGVGGHLFRETGDSWGPRSLRLTTVPNYSIFPTIQRQAELGCVLSTVLVTAPTASRMRHGLYCCAPALPRDLLKSIITLCGSRQGLSEVDREDDGSLQSSGSIRRKRKPGNCQQLLLLQCGCQPTNGQASQAAKRLLNVVP